MLTEFFNVLQSENLMSEKEVLIFSFLITSIITLAGFLVKAIAIFIMARNAGLKNKWMAFVPFLNFVLLGKVVGPVRSFGLRMKNVGLFLAIISFSIEIMYLLLNLGYYFSMIGYIFNIEITASTAFGKNWLNGVGALFFIVKGLVYILNFAEILIYVSLVFAVFKKYAPERMIIYGLISVFFEFFFGIILLVIANKKPVDYDDYVRRMREQQMRNYYGGYNYYNQNNPYANRNNFKNEDPFPEFSNNSNDGEDKSNDDFFN